MELMGTLLFLLEVPCFISSLRSAVRVVGERGLSGWIPEAAWTFGTIPCSVNGPQPVS